MKKSRAVFKIGDDYTAELEHESPARAETVAGLGFLFGTFAIRDISITPAVHDATV